MFYDPIEAIVRLAESRGIKAINRQPGLTHIPIDDNWDVWVNPHSTAIKREDGMELQPFRFLIEWNGWPASIFHPGEETVVFAVGECANLETFCAAVDRSIEEAREAS